MPEQMGYESRVEPNVFIPTKLKTTTLLTWNAKALAVLIVQWMNQLAFIKENWKCFREHEPMGPLTDRIACLELGISHEQLRAAEVELQHIGMTWRSERGFFRINQRHPLLSEPFLHESCLESDQDAPVEQVVKKDSKKERAARRETETCKNTLPLRIDMVELAGKYGFDCTYCGGHGNKHYGPDRRPWHADHIIPRVRGGSNEPKNITLACSTCNIRKNDKTAEEFRQIIAAEQVVTL